MFKNKISERRIKSKRKKKKSMFNRFGFTPIYLIALILVAAVALVVIVSKVDIPDGANKINLNVTNKRLVKDASFKKFASADEFKAYLKEVDDSANYGFSSGSMRALAQPAMMEDGMDFAKSESINLGGGGADRVSDTNVQVLGIDEPDIVKTNGQEIFFSDNLGGYWTNAEAPLVLEDFDLDGDFEEIKFENKRKTNIINAWPPSDLELNSEIDLSGELLLVEDTLVVFSGKDITAYDVSDSKNPNKKWNIKLDDNTYLNTSRLYNDKIYLITQTRINNYNPCPISPLLREGEAMIVPCTDIYYPVSPGQVNSTFTAISLDVDSGEFEKEISFVGDQNTSNVYMSKEAMYIAYEQNLDMFDFMFDFVSTEMKDLLPSDLQTKLNKLSTYDISSNSKLNELQTILNDWQGSLDKDEMLRIETEMQNRMETYYEDNKRSMTTTGIVKINIDNLEIDATGTVPGYLLNQFSMDEYDNNLRVATTIGERWGWGRGGRDSQANDIYVLDDNLKIKGSILDLGLTERIYAARFIGDVGYLVTFRQIDPFYVLDLSDASNPKMVGELKIPGYSSYLHPIDENRVLGIGMEDRKVKISYFDVSNPADPQEIDKYSLDEYGSEALYNHHAFLEDPKHEVFFLPSYKGGYVFSYANDKIELVKALNVPDVKRALYLDDYMYVLANDYIAVLNENDWEKVNDLDL
jgi:inhibitor of cysteine peptidase